MNRTKSEFYLNKVLQVASELKYQLPLTRVEFVEQGCGSCGARARFPGPCVECAELELMRLIGDEHTRRWVAACREQQQSWRSLEDKVSVMSRMPTMNL